MTFSGLKGLLFPAPILNHTCKPIDFTTVNMEWLETFTSRMLITMVQAGGVGLAAPQVGEGLRVFVLDVDWILHPEKSNPLVAINPVITPVGEEINEEVEGCLSFPGVTRRVERHTTVKLDAFMSNGTPYSIELEGYAARVAQHENDHLNGIHFGSGLSWLNRRELAKKMKGAFFGQFR